VPLITRKTAADLLGLSVRRVGQIVEEGNGPPQARGGSFPAREFGQWMIERELAKRGGVGLDLTAERARLAKAQADKTELEVAELRGELVSAQEVIEAWTQYIAAIRARLLALPSKARPGSRRRDWWPRRRSYCAALSTRR
jgi:phage terminase Nu1 subunit (DNA packaging protein)